MMNPFAFPFWFGEYYAEEFNWPVMVAAVARVYHALPADEQAGTAIFCHSACNARIFSALKG